MTSQQIDRFGDLLRAQRLAAGLTQEALAARAGVSAKAIGGLERDPARKPRLSTVALLADALELPAAERARLVAAARRVPAPAAPPLPAETIPSAWPRPLTPLFGRDGVIEAVAELVCRGSGGTGSRLLTLTGPGGVGKTRLAIAAAERVAETFPDGAVYVDLAPLRDPNLVLDAIARSLAIDDRDRVPLAERLTAALRQQHRLLLLDNFEHVLPARNEVLALLAACPRLMVLVTSREPLRVRGEREYRIAPLALPEMAASPDVFARAPAVALFIDRAHAAGTELALTETTAAAIAEICRRLDGLPLAIELAAAWTRLLPPPELLARLQRRLPLLVGGAPDLPARQRTMRDTIAWSYDLLDPAEQLLFRRLCVFAGGCTLAAAAAICGEDESAILIKLADLHDCNLLRASATAPDGAEFRVTLLETIREFGLEQLEERGKVEEVRQRHAAYFLDLAEAAQTGLIGPEGAVWRARLEREHDNLRAALSWALVNGDDEAALRLSGALWRFWSEGGHLSEGRHWLRQALALPTTRGSANTAVRAKALVGAAQLAIEQRAYDEAAHHCARAVVLARDGEAPVDLLLALNLQGRLAMERGEYAASGRYHEQARLLACSLNDQPGLAAASFGLGYATACLNDQAQADHYFAQSLAIARAIGDERSLATALIGVALVRLHAGAFAPVETAAAEALALSRGIGDTGRIAEALWLLGLAAQFQGYLDQAISFQAESLALRRERGDEDGAINSLLPLAAIAHRQGQKQRARMLLAEARAMIERLDHRWARAMALIVQGHIELAANNRAVAVSHLSKAASLFAALEHLLYLPWCLEGLAGAAAAGGAWRLVARLAGSRAALVARLGLGLPPLDPAAYTRTVEDSRANLGGDAFAAAYHAEQTLSLDEAVTAVMAAVRTAGDPNPGPLTSSRMAVT